MRVDKICGAGYPHYRNASALPVHLQIDESFIILHATDCSSYTYNTGGVNLELHQQVSPSVNPPG